MAAVFGVGCPTVEKGSGYVIRRGLSGGLLVLRSRRDALHARGAGRGERVRPAPRGRRVLRRVSTHEAGGHDAAEITRAWRLSLAHSIAEPCAPFDPDAGRVIKQRRQSTPPPKRRTDMATWLWIVIIVVAVLAVTGYFGRGRFSR